MSADRCAARSAARSREAAARMGDSDCSMRVEAAARCIAAEAPEGRAEPGVERLPVEARGAVARRSVAARRLAATTAAAAEAATAAGSAERAGPASLSPEAERAATAAAAEAEAAGAETAEPPVGRAAQLPRPFLSPFQRNKDIPFSTAEPLSRRWGRPS